MGRRLRRLDRADRFHRPRPLSGERRHHDAAQLHPGRSAGGRAGYAFGRFLPYFAAGATWGRTEQRDQATLSEKGRIPSDAWTVGAGLEYMLADRLSLRGEYLFEDTYRNAKTSLSPCTACTQSLTGSMVRFGLAYYFH